MFTICCDDGGNIPSVIKAGLARSGGCVGAQSDFKRLTPENSVSVIEESMYYDLD